MTVYAISENGGRSNERLRHERFGTKREALDLASQLTEIEALLIGWDIDDDDWTAYVNAEGECRTTFDVMRQLADGSWTTEC